MPGVSERISVMSLGVTAVSSRAKGKNTSQR